MAQNETWLNHDMMNAVKVQYLDGNVFSMDNAGNLIGVHLTRNGVDYSGGGSVSANVIRADGETVAVSGALSGANATVVLPQAAYAVPGVLSVIIKLTVSGEITTIGAVVANVYQSSTDTIVDPGTIIPSVTALIAAIEAAVASIPADYSSLWASLAPAFSSSVAYSTGQYVTYNGNLYRFVMNRTAGDWDAGYCETVSFGNDIYKNKNAILDYIDSVKYSDKSYNAYIPYTIETGIYDWNLNLNQGITNGVHLVAEVKENSVYIICGQRFVKSYPAIIFLQNNTNLGYENADVALSERFTNIYIRTPEGCNKIYINGITTNFDSAAPMIKEVNVMPEASAYEAADFEIEAGVYTNGYELNTAVGIHGICKVKQGDIVRFSSYKYASSYPIILFKNNGSFVGYVLGDVSNATRQRNIFSRIPSGVDEIVVQCDDKLRINIDKLIESRPISSWKGKTILFTGTSISATGTTFRDGYYSIPDYICKLLGATAVDVAKGESMLRRGYEFAISANDPYGWTGGYWNNVAYSLMTTYDEKDDLITNWESKWRDLLQGSDKPQTLTDEQKTLFRSCSFENKIVPYLDGTNSKPDMIVIEHGRNDVVWWNPTAETFDGVADVNPDSMSDYHRSKYGDALAYLVRLIRQYDRDIPILLVGHFDNSGVFGQVHLQEQQKAGAEYNGIFYCSTIETGWNDCKVTVTGQWVDGYWIEDGTERVYTRRHQNMPDDIHPASAKSGEAIMIEAGIIANFINSNISPQI